MSLVTLKNDDITVVLNSAGAVLHSVIKDGCEYIWQGDEKYWKSRDYNLFPYVGRLTEDSYFFRGARYGMSRHGFVRGMEFEVSELSDTSVTFSVSDNDETRSMYPFSFIFSVSYSLSGSTVMKTVNVQNTGSSEMFFGLGFHPGFNVPLDGDEEFESWYLEFDEESDPVRMCFNPENFRLSGIETPYELAQGRIFSLDHSLFDNDAVVLSRMPKAVTLRSPLSKRSVKVAYPDMNFLGIWHMPKTDAPYVCIEPWLSLPSHSSYIENLEDQEFLQELDAGKQYTNTMTIEFI